MKPPRILVVTNGPLCRNPRVVKEASTLAAAGYDVTALTVRNHLPSEPIDLTILSQQTFKRLVIDLLPGAGSAAFRRRLLQRLARDAATRLGWKSIYSLGPAGPTLRTIRAFAADLTIVHNEVPHWAGARLLAAGFRIAVDFEDWHSEDLLPGDRRGRPLRQIRAVERRLLHDSVGCTTTSEALADALHQRYSGMRPRVITNCFPLQPDPRSGPVGEPPAFLWFSQTMGPGRGLEEFLVAWSKTTRPSRICLLGDAHSGYPARLLASVPQDRHSFVQFLSPVPPDRLPGVIAQHDIGLALEPCVPANKNLTISNKILQYLNAGLAVVATQTAGQREVFSHAPGAGILVDLAAPAATAAALDTLIGDRTQLAAAQCAARAAAAQTYCWEREAPHLLAAVATALHRLRP